ncbi:MAG: LPS export ABC transporter ATP-binding protein [Acidobacteriota bacterium]|jgi:lipopolysaccharide export system ATP-binding protein|nr:LPS export ABC transporter ATP-binding protein [Acidobacteriota bacterium]
MIGFFPQEHENDAAGLRDPCDSDMNRLEANQLTKIYDGVAVVNSLSLWAQGGEILGLLGPNGAGKTTTFLMLAGIIKPDRGEVRLNKENVNSDPSHVRAQKGLVYLPQQHSVFMKASVFKNLFQILELRLPVTEARARTEELLAEFGLEYVKDSPAHQLSGGEKRRLEIARAMIMNPRFLFLDEPFTGIDPITIVDIQATIVKLRERGIGVIITDHNVKDTFNITNRVYVIHRGQILSSGSPGQVVREEQTRKLFLGNEFEWGKDTFENPDAPLFRGVPGK